MEEKQWWITGFNFNYQNVNIANLKATFAVVFENDKIYNAFNRRNIIDNYGWQEASAMKLSYVL